MSATRKLVLPGGSGFLGRLLARWFGDRGRDIITLTRRPDALPPAGRSVCWDGRTLADWRHELNGADAVVNLAGRSVNCRYHARNRRTATSPC
jgi:NAD dependent epimerase/dehydratase family enzyme